MSKNHTTILKLTTRAKILNKRKKKKRAHDWDAIASPLECQNIFGYNADVSIQNMFLKSHWVQISTDRNYGRQERKPKLKYTKKNNKKRDINARKPPTLHYVACILCDDSGSLFFPRLPVVDIEAGLESIHRRQLAARTSEWPSARLASFFFCFFLSLFIDRLRWFGLERPKHSRRVKMWRWWWWWYRRWPAMKIACNHAAQLTPCQEIRQLELIF